MLGNRPCSTAVTIEEFKELPEKNLVVIRGTIHVERNSQKNPHWKRRTEIEEDWRAGPKRGRSPLRDKDLFRILGECGEKLDTGPPRPESVGLSVTLLPSALR
jgi:hypothetical protein